MFIRTPGDLGAIIRERRRELGLGQAQLAGRIGVSRQWVIGVERGRARAELGLVLRALDSLGVCLNASAEAGQARSGAAPDIDAIIASPQKGA